MLRICAGTALLLLCLCALGFAKDPKNDSVSSSKSAADPAVGRARVVDDAARCAVPGEKNCGIHFRGALVQAGQLLAILHMGNRPTYKGEFRGKFFPRWFDAVSKQRFSVWNDNDPFIVDYVGHPMTGATVGSILIQNDPKTRQIGFENSRRYWSSRAKAMAYSAVYSVQWEIGPFSEASFGHLGAFNYYSKASGGMTNGTGMSDYVMTPVAGTALIVVEDLVYSKVQARLLATHRHPLKRLAISFMTPNRSFANILRWHAPWSRD